MSVGIKAVLSKSDKIILSILFLFSLAGFTLAFEYFNVESCKKSLISWINSEKSTVQQGDVYQAITRAEKYFVDSGFFKGLKVDKVNKNDTNNFLTYGKIPRNEKPEKIASAKIATTWTGLFSYRLSYVFESRPDWVFSFYYTSEYTVFLIPVLSFLIVSILSVFLAYLRFESRQSMEDLVKVNKFIIQISTQVGHDIRSPLTALKVGADSLLLKDSEAGSLIFKSIERIENIASDLLDKRITLDAMASGAELDQSRATLIKAIFIFKKLQDIVNEKRTVNKAAKNINFELLLPDPKEISLWAVRDDLARVFSNIIENAIDASSINDDVTIEASFDKSYLNINVTDRGPGIPAEIMSRIGERGITYGKQGDGNGLGIYHACESMDKIGGKIIFKSRNGPGTITSILIPRLN